MGELIRERGGEFGTTTGRPRRTGWLDLVALRYAARLNTMTALVVTKLDVLSGLDRIQVCTSYRGAEGADVRRLPLPPDRPPPHDRRADRAAGMEGGPRRVPHVLRSARRRPRVPRLHRRARRRADHARGGWPGTRADDLDGRRGRRRFWLRAAPPPPPDRRDRKLAGSQAGLRRIEVRQTYPWGDFRAARSAARMVSPTKPRPQEAGTYSPRPSSLLSQ